MFKLDPAFAKPTYDRHSFSAIPRSIAGLLGKWGEVALPPEALVGIPATYRQVVLILADGFGWRFFEKYADGYPALQRLWRRGTATRLTSLFPSTTAAHLTCLHTGLDAGASGVYEWQYYEPQLDAIIAPLLFSFAGTQEREQLRAAGVRPEHLLPNGMLYHSLASLGVSSTVFQHREYASSSYSEYMFRGASAIGYRTLPEALVNLCSALGRDKGAGYFVLYHDRLDGLVHEYGPDAPQTEAEFDAFLTALERHFFIPLAAARSGDLLVILTADHGEVETDPATCRYLNTDSLFAGVQRFLATDRQGRPLVPAGSARDFFLHVKAPLLDEAQQFLQDRLDGEAVVYRTGELIDAGFFGIQPPSEAFRKRVGNLVILPYAGKSVWWYERNRFEQRFYGHHGGLTPQEMEIPLLVGAF